MRTPETHAREVAAALPARQATTVPLTQAQDMVLAADIHAGFPSPPVSYTHLTLPTTPYV